MHVLARVCVCASVSVCVCVCVRVRAQACSSPALRIECEFVHQLQLPSKPAYKLRSGVPCVQNVLHARNTSTPLHILSFVYPAWSPTN